jgi:hypothetical protein
VASDDVPIEDVSRARAALPGAPDAKSRRAFARDRA